MPLTKNLALVSDTTKLTAADLTKVGSALQKQATRDFGPLWGIEATVSPFARLEDVPIDYWPIIVRDDIGVSGAAGVHEDKNGQPFSLVQYSTDWSLTASHEMLEMLADPFGKRLVAGKAPAGAPKAASGRVNFLVEVGDPSESAEFGYTVNGVLVSDFYTPHFFDPVRSAVRYSFTDAIKSPRTILRGGYLSWVVPATNEWFQIVWFGTPQPHFRSLGILKGKGSLRSQIDALTTPSVKQESAAKTNPLTASADGAESFTSLEEERVSSNARATSLRTEIEARLKTS